MRNTRCHLYRKDADIMSMHKVTAILICCAIALSIAAGIAIPARADGLLGILGGLQQFATALPTEQPTYEPTVPDAVDENALGMWYALFTPASDDIAATAAAIGELRAYIVNAGFSEVSVSWSSDNNVVFYVDQVTQADAPFAALEAPSEPVSVLKFTDENDNVLLSNEDIASAEAIIDYGLPGITLTFTESGAKTFAQATGDNLGKTIYIKLDGQLLLAPVVQAPIVGGSVTISGGNIELITIQKIIDAVQSSGAPVSGLTLETASFSAYGADGLG